MTCGDPYCICHLGPALARVRSYSPDGTPCESVTCYSPDAIVHAISKARPSDSVKVQVL